jgi:hypothetical protein
MSWHGNHGDVDNMFVMLRVALRKHTGCTVPSDVDALRATDPIGQTIAVPCSGQVESFGMRLEKIDAQSGNYG